MNKPYKKRTPKFLESLLEKILVQSDRESLSGDFKEMYSRICNEKGVVAATSWYLLHIVKLLPAFIETTTFRSIAMSKNYFKIALRNIRRHKTISFINISGLAAGMTAVLLIWLYVHDELSYDMYHENIAGLYRFETVPNLVGPAAASPVLKAMPEVIETVRIQTTYGEERLIRYGEKRFFEKRLIFADPSIFDVFTIPMIEGDPGSALSDVNSIIITESIAKKYFGDSDPIGETLLIFNAGLPMKVSGIVKDIPANSHFKFDFIVPMKFLGTLGSRGQNLDDNWRWWDFYHYAHIADGTDLEKLTGSLEEIAAERMGSQNPSIRYYARPVKDIHLTAHGRNQMEANGNVLYVYILIATAFFTLFIACVNFMNLSTARSTTRTREIGMRKVVGARRIQVIGQFLMESVVISSLAFAVALLAVYFLLPLYSGFTNKQFSFSIMADPSNLMLMLAFVFTIGITVGGYPALLFSGFNVANILKGNNNSVLKGAYFRKILVVTQFSISIMLIIGTMVIASQLDFIRNKNIGFDKHQTIVVRMKSNREIIQNVERFKSEFQQSALIKGVAVTSGLPGGQTWGNNITVQGSEQIYETRLFVVDHDFMDVLNIELVEGRNYSKEFPNDGARSIIFNEAAVREYGLKEPVGSSIFWGNDTLTVIGVVKDFHFRSLHDEIGPLSLLLGPGFTNLFLVKTVSKNVNETLTFLRDKWQELAPDVPFEYSFLDTEFDRIHEADRKLGIIFDYFTLLVIFIACIGLFGLASFNVVQRIKEVGVRKVLGATPGGLAALLVKDSVMLIAVANIIAWPGAYYLMDNWLQTFAYRADIDISIFLLAGILVFGIGTATVLFHALKAAHLDPVKSLRYE